MQLTKYIEGSLQELWAIAGPLMLASFSAMTMIFCDRWFLAYYSIDAHNAAVSAATFGWACIFGGVVLANVVEVFVAQFNGAGMRNRLAEPVWQMIWFSMASWLFYIPLFLWGGNWIYGTGIDSALERDYFCYMIIFGPFYALNGALSGFFIGQGKTRIITVLMVLANMLNVFFDWILIFGVKGWIEPMGVKGAAIATSLAIMIQCVVLGCVFLNKKYRKECGSNYCSLNLTLLWDCLRVGLPTALFMVTEILAFAVYYVLMKDMGIFYITVTGICQSMLILFLFFPEGMNKATATVVGNMIGAGRQHLVSNVMKAALKLNLLFLIVLLAAFIFCMPLIIDQFLPHADASFISEVQKPLGPCLVLIALYLFFEGIRMQFAGVLMAAGDTLFLFVTGALSVWIVMLLPVYYLVIRNGASIEVAVAIEAVYSMIVSLVYYLRVRQGKWKSYSLSNEIENRV